MAGEYHPYRSRHVCARVQSSTVLQPTVACPPRIDEADPGGASLTKVFGDSSALRLIQGSRRLRASVACLWMFSITTCAEQLPLRLYSTQDGLWSGFINHIMRDSRGFLWFCTRDGLSRFDGYCFTNYRVGGASSSQNFTYMFETRSGIFWIVLSDNRVYRYDPSSITGPVTRGTPPAPVDQRDDDRVVLQAKLVSSEQLTGMVHDRRGNLWAVLTHKTVSVPSPQDKTT